MTIKKLKRDDTLLMVIDLQEKLMPAMNEKEALEDAAARIIKGCRSLGVPVIVTEQYRKGLGPTIPAADEALTMKLDNAPAATYTPLEKFTFSAAKADQIMGAIEETGRKTVIVIGVEAHICVEQTVIDLLEKGYTVFVAGDCIGSRKFQDQRYGEMRMKDAGAVFTTAESALFELLESSKEPQFKEISRIIK